MSTPPPEKRSDKLECPQCHQNLMCSVLGETFQGNTLYQVPWHEWHDDPKSIAWTTCVDRLVLTRTGLTQKTSLRVPDKPMGEGIITLCPECRFATKALPFRKLGYYIYRVHGACPAGGRVAHIEQTDKSHTARYPLSNAEVDKLLSGDDDPVTVSDMFTDKQDGPYAAAASIGQPQSDRRQYSEVDHPPHYGGGDNPYEAIKVIDAWELGFNLGNTVKYISRAGKKPGADTRIDLLKAKFYLDAEIEKLRRRDEVEHADVESESGGPKQVSTCPACGADSVPCACDGYQFGSPVWPDRRPPQPQPQSPGASSIPDPWDQRHTVKPTAEYRPSHFRKPIE